MKHCVKSCCVLAGVAVVALTTAPFSGGQSPRNPPPALSELWSEYPLRDGTVSTRSSEPTDKDEPRTRPAAPAEDGGSPVGEPPPEEPRQTVRVGARRLSGGLLLAAVLALTLATITAIVFHRRRHPLRTDEAFQGEPRETPSASPSGNSRGGHDELVQARIEAWDKARREREQLRDQLSALEREAARARELQPALTDELLLAERRAEQARVRAEEEAGALVRRAEAEGGRFLRVAQAKRDELREETLRLRAIERELRSNYLDLIEAAAVLLGDVPDRHTGEGEADEALPPCSPARTSRAAGSPASGS